MHKVRYTFSSLSLTITLFSVSLGVHANITNVKQNSNDQSALVSQQSTPHSTQADLLYVYQLALKNDTTLSGQKAQMNVTHEGVTQSRAGLLPSINLIANTQYNNADVQFENGTNNRAQYNSYGWGATLQQPLFNLAHWFTYSQAKSASMAANYQYYAAQQNLILRVAKGYFNILRAKDNLLTAQAQESAVKQQLDQAEERYNVGLIAETDVLEARAAYDDARVSRILAANDLSVSYENLRIITNRPINNVGLLKKDMPVLAPTPAIPQQWVLSAIKNNFSLKASRESIQTAEKNIKIQRSDHAPTVNAFASYNYASDNSLRGNAIDDSGLIIKNGKSDLSVIGINVTMPIFSGGATSSMVRQAKYQLEKTQDDFDTLLRTTSSDTRNIVQTVQSDVARVAARKQGIISSESALRATESGYEVGTRNITDVLTAQKNLYEAQGDYLNARYDFIINTLELKQLAGTLNPNDLKDLNAWITFNKANSTATLPFFQHVVLGNNHGSQSIKNKTASKHKPVKKGTGTHSAIKK